MPFLGHLVCACASHSSVSAGDAKNRRWRSRHRANVVRSGKLHSLIGETVCLPDAFPRDGNAFILSNRKTIVRPYLCASHFSTCVPETSARRCRTPIHTNVGVLCTVERVNGGKVPDALKEKATDATFLLALKSQYRLPFIFILGGLVSALISCLAQVTRQERP